MSDLSVTVLTTNSKDGAAKALDTVKQLDHEGWIDLMDYAVISKDEKGHITVREADDEFAEKVTAAAVGVAGGVVGAGLGGPAGAVAGAAAGAAVGAGSIHLIGRLVPDKSFEGIPESLTNNSSALAVVVEERYVERLDEELEKLGRTAQREMKRAEREAELNAYIKRAKDRIKSLQNDIKTQLTKAQAATEAEKARIEADLAVKQAELKASREKLEHQISAMNSDLKAEIREMNFRLEMAGLSAKAGITAGIDHLHRKLNAYSDDLENLIEDKIEMLKEDTSQLKAKASRVTGETKTAIETHLQAVEAQLRKERVKLLDSFQERLLQTKQWFENLQVRSSLAKAELRDKLQACVKKAQQSLAELKAHVRMRNREDERAWKDIRQGFNKACKEMADAFDKAEHEGS